MKRVGSFHSELHSACWIHTYSSFRHNSWVCCRHGGDKFKYELLGIQLEVKHVSIWKLECANLTNRSSFTHTQVTHRNHRLSTYMYLRAFFRQRDLFRVFCYHGCQKVNHLHVHLQHFHQILVVHLWNACKYLR